MFQVITCFKKIFESCEVFAKLIKKSPKFLYDNLLIFKSDLTESIKSMFLALESMEAAMGSAAIRNLLLNLDRNRYFRNKYSLLNINNQTNIKQSSTVNIDKSCSISNLNK